MKKNKKKIVTIITIIILFIFLLLYKHIYDEYHLGIPCIFNKITKLYCPGCGMTRAIFYLLELDIRKSIKCNALLYIVGPFIIIYMINFVYIWINDLKKDPSKIINKHVWYLLLIISITYAVMRNIDYFSWLRPI